MSRRLLPLVFVSGLCVLSVAGFSSGSTPGGTQRSDVEVRLRVTSYRDTVRHVHVFTLACKPTGGTLPLAARVVVTSPSMRGRCSTRRKAGQAHDAERLRAVLPGCRRLPVTAKSERHDPGLFPGRRAATGQAIKRLAVYYDAAESDTHDLTRSELELRCDEDPVLFRVPTPLGERRRLQTRPLDTSDPNN